MGVLCFVVDLPSLSPPLLADFKQGLLQLANYYAISSSSHSLADRIALCYLFLDRLAASSEVKVAYSPRGDFNLRDFHHAVNKLPTDAFSPETSNPDVHYSCNIKLSSMLHDQALYSWGSGEIARKVIVISSCLPQDIDASLHKSLTDAADRCISFEFLFFETRSSHLHNVQENTSNFARSISDLENCSMRTCLPDARVLHGMVKRWLQDLKDETEEQFHAQIIFKNNLVGSAKQIFCNLSASAKQITNFLSTCQTCRCHGTVLNEEPKTMLERYCPITGHDLASPDVIENTLRVGEKVILLMPSIPEVMKLQKVSAPIGFHIIERTNLGSLSEGIMFGTPYVVTPSASHEIGASSVENTEIELNAQLLLGLCKVLHSLDQGLVCYSYFNTETMRSDSLPCYYVLQPSENGPMLLRHLAGLEEMLPIPDIDRFYGCSLTEEIEQSIGASIQMMESKDYDPFQHDRGFHQNLNSLVEESLQFGSIAPNEERAVADPDSNRAELDASNPPNANIQTLNPAASEPEEPDLNAAAEGDGTSSARVLEEEWEQLVITEVPMARNPASSVTSNSTYTCSKAAALTMPEQDGRQRLDIKTSKILERLEVPRQFKMSAVSPEMKPTVTAGSGNQLIIPNFNRLKRKHK